MSNARGTSNVWAAPCVSRLLQDRDRGSMLRAGDVHILRTTRFCSAWRDVGLTDPAGETAACFYMQQIEGDEE